MKNMLVSNNITLPRLLEKETKLVKLVFFVPESHKEIVKNELFGIGAGSIGNYDQCSFEVEGLCHLGHLMEQTRLLVKLTR